MKKKLLNSWKPTYDNGICKRKHYAPNSSFTKQSSDEVRKILKEFKLELAYPKEQTASERGLYDVYVLDRFLFAISTQSPLYEN